MEKITNTTEVARRARKQLKEKFPGCKFSVRTEWYSGGSSITLSLMQADRQVIKKYEEIQEHELEILALRRGDELEQVKSMVKETQSRNHHQLSERSLLGEYEGSSWCNGVFLTKEGHDLLQKAVRIIQQYNWDNSDPMTDYFDVNFYLNVHLGRWDKPMEVIA